MEMERKLYPHDKITFRNTLFPSLLQPKLEFSYSNNNNVSVKHGGFQESLWLKVWISETKQAKIKGQSVTNLL